MGTHDFSSLSGAWNGITRRGGAETRRKKDTLLNMAISRRGETPASLGYTMPAEWEPHEATWIAWPHNPTDWPDKLDTIRWVYTEIVRRVSAGEKVRILVNSRAEAKSAVQYLT